MTAAPHLWLLDTNIISGLMKDPRGEISVQLAQKARQIPDAKVATSVIVDCELKFGLAKIASARLLHAYTVTMAAIDVLDFEGAAAQRYANLRSYLEAQGTPVGPNDMLIAAHALALNCTLVTDNEEEFCRIPGLKVENWLRPRQI
jgi:tRNA(fMet)-specific endonuclease VapC